MNQTPPFSVRHHPFPALCLSGGPSGFARPAPCLRSHNKAAVTPSPLASPSGNSWNRGRGVKETKNPQGPVILHWSRHVFSSPPLIYHAVPASKRLIAFHTVVCQQSGTFPAGSGASLQHKCIIYTSSTRMLWSLSTLNPNQLDYF